MELTTPTITPGLNNICGVKIRVEKEILLSTQFELDKCLIKWMDILKLNEWEIVIKFDNKIDSKAIINFYGEVKQAIIRLVEPEEYLRRKFDFKWDMEETIVHELLHIKLEGIMHTVPDNVYNIAEYHEECLIEDLSRVIVEQHRRGNNVPC